MYATLLFYFPGGCLVYQTPSSVVNIHSLLFSNLFYSIACGQKVEALSFVRLWRKPARCALLFLVCVCLNSCNANKENHNGVQQHTPGWPGLFSPCSPCVLGLTLG